MAEISCTPGLVMGNPHVNAVSQPPHHGFSIICEGVGRITGEPATAVLQCQGQIPMVERGNRADIPGEQVIDQAVIEIQAAFIDCPRSRRQDAGPGEREAIGVQIKLSHERNVFRHAVVVICCYLACLALIRCTGRRRKVIPDGGSSSIFMGRALYLVSRGSGTPEKVWREKGSRCGLLRLYLRVWLGHSFIGDTHQISFMLIWLLTGC